MTSEERSPSEDCALDGEQFFELNVPTVSGIHPEFSFPVIPDMFTYPERCPPALSVYVLTHPDP